MSPSLFLQRLQAGETLVADGATGTNLQGRGLGKGVPSETWVLERPEQIIQLHRDFIAAGSDIVLTCTFGGSSIRMDHIGLAGKTLDVNRQAVALAREAAQGTAVLVAGSIGPTGQMLKPLGLLDEADAFKAFAEQAKILAEAGADLLVIETQFDLNEASTAIKAAQSVCSLPLVCSFSYDRGTRTMMGLKPALAGKEVTALGVSAVGINCGRGLDENLKVLQELKQATDLPIWFKPNAGLPTVDAQGESVYGVTPEMMGSQVAEWIAAGARIVGGCCGTSPAHLQKIAQAAKKK